MTAVLAAQAPSDAQLRADVQRSIASLKLGSAKVTVTVEDKIAMLDGMVPTLWAKRQAVNAALKTPGIQKVQSTLTITKGESDDVLAYQLGLTIQGYPRYSVYDYIDGVVKNGEATLVGAITTEQKFDEIVERVEKIRGLHGLDNRIKVLPASQSDDGIRYRIATLIYGDPLFQQYSMANPPIHVVVDRGRVTLVGIVSGDVERQKAYTIARSTPGVFNVDNQVKTTAELRGR